MVNGHLKQKEKLLTAEMDFCIWSARISRKYKIQNQVIRGKMGLKYSILDNIKTKQSGSDMPKERQIDRCSKQALESLPSGRRKTKLHGLKKSIMWWQREEWKKGSGCIENNGSWKSENVNGIKKRCVCVFSCINHESRFVLQRAWCIVECTYLSQNIQEIHAQLPSWLLYLIALT